MWAALPASNAWAPTIPFAYPAPTSGPFIAGLSERSMEYLNVSAVTGAFEGGEKRNPGRILKV